MKILLVFLSLTAFSKVYQVKRNISFKGDVDKAMDIMLDQENFCRSGCDYKISSVKEVKILEKKKNSMITWTDVSDRKSYQYFLVMKWDKSPKGYNITFEYPSKSELRRLKKSYGLRHKTAFSKYYVEWNFHQKDGDTINVRHYTRHVCTSWTLNTFFLIVYDGIKKSLNEYYDALKMTY